MESPVEHIQVPMVFDTDKMDVSFDLETISKLAIKMKLLAEIKELEQKHLQVSN